MKRSSSLEGLDITYSKSNHDSSDRLGSSCPAHVAGDMSVLAVVAERQSLLPWLMNL